MNCGITKAAIFSVISMMWGNESLLKSNERISLTKGLYNFFRDS